MTDERLKKRFLRLVAANQAHIVQEDKLEAASNDQERALATLGVMGARQARDNLLHKWGLYPNMAVDRF